ncbi:hypothetical protein MA16_Dca026898 [Dendrobium catenatum]|uniref:Uncharacterized protein n=1 Tax=Dendrobium catenatum TaxID=906689 RepID=A0A2I0VFD8_9ASPA|nr:hypothetical protein MA16_Dca026898 [Dendrobium catenatum]
MRFTRAEVYIGGGNNLGRRTGPFKFYSSDEREPNERAFSSVEDHLVLNSCHVFSVVGTVSAPSVLPNLNVDCSDELIPDPVLLGEVCSPVAVVHEGDACSAEVLTVRPYEDVVMGGWPARVANVSEARAQWRKGRKAFEASCVLEIGNWRKFLYMASKGPHDQNKLGNTFSMEGKKKNNLNLGEITE